MRLLFNYKNMRGKKTSSEDKAKVISSKIANVDNSLRDIEKETGVNYWTVKDILDKDLPEVLTSSNKTINLVDVNIDIMTTWKDIILKEIKNLGKWEWEVKIRSVNDIKSLSSTLEDAFKQNQLLKWDATENIKVNDYRNLTTSELLAMKDKK